MGYRAKKKLASWASGARYGGEKERKLACGHSTLNAAPFWYHDLIG